MMPVLDILLIHTFESDSVVRFNKMSQTGDVPFVDYKDYIISDYRIKGEYPQKHH